MIQYDTIQTQYILIPTVLTLFSFNYSSRTDCSRKDYERVATVLTYSRFCLQFTAIRDSCRHCTFVMRVRNTLFIAKAIR